ncbi:protein-glutamate methylesterase/protein-glutamine glutaminase [Nocardioides okcheonensis]|uniref:protein-glutamate methylesterase/protein-glutamine glutaminase n=1 Tax=Nocardioides okcheonensis TaxID=2894081 RepID=UPI001E649B2C|nr:chemotaxis response regulator protein-glutamate methylesterase [Nocardioides okcheonensis]UFN43030.1 chemotaxis response regulator protein-glutamate methylesterase [Nocardioides okcheonensis]
MSRKVRVLVVDDSVVVRRLVAEALAADPQIEVVGTAANGRVALAKIAQVNPDLVTLDIEMPVMDGLETLRHLRPLHPRLPVVMFSTLTERGATATLDALELGASDYVTKPANVGSVMASMEAVRQQLVPKIHGLCRRIIAPPAPPRPLLTAPVAPLAPRGRPATATNQVDVVAIGASTGGPDALSAVLAALPADLGVPVVVVQHMPPVFTRQFADRLNGKVPLHVSEASAGDPVVAGGVLVAPGDHHLRFRGTRALPSGIVAALDQGTPEHYCRPAVDVMFRSVVETWGGHVLAVVLTGMGSDGASGCAAVVAAGGSALVQDEATSVVWGMPRAVVEAGVPAQVLPLHQIGPAIVDRVRRGRRGPYSPREAALA